MIGSRKDFFSKQTDKITNGQFLRISEICVNLQISNEELDKYIKMFNPKAGLVEYLDRTLDFPTAGELVQYLKNLEIKIKKVKKN